MISYCWQPKTSYDSPLVPGVLGNASGSGGHSSVKYHAGLNSKYSMIISSSSVTTLLDQRMTKGYKYRLSQGEEKLRPYLSFKKAANCVKNDGQDTSTHFLAICNVKEASKELKRCIVASTE